MTNPRKFSGRDMSVVTLMDEFNLESLDDVLKPRYRGHSYDFWFELQMLHDTEAFWSPDGITQAGINKRDEMIKTWQ